MDIQKHSGAGGGNFGVPDFVGQIGQDSANKYSQNRRFGNWGEGVACEILKEKGMKIVERNFLRKCGELDIVAEKDGILHFVEVKTVTRDITTYDGLGIVVDGSEAVGINPFENIDRRKMLRMKRTIAVYLAEHNMSPETQFQIDVAAVTFFLPDMIGSVEFIDNVIE
ncbi:MAG: YraN family protein [Candidatus Pacebacteria bacterium]|nr:YraN family protein [Candidatus Paceibacterota bacterium]